MNVEQISGVVLFFLLVVFLYFILFHDYVMGFIRARRKFECLRCGRCCSLKLRLYPDDIKRLKSAGYKDFLYAGKFMKRINGYCVFLELKKGKASCSVNSIKPRICCGFPRFKRFGLAFVDRRCLFYKKKARA